MKLVLVEWHDSRGAGPSWNFVSTIREDGICPMRSVGWVVVENDQELCIAPHVGHEKDGEHQVCGEMHIPKTCIDSIKVLKNKR